MQTNVKLKEKNYKIWYVPTTKINFIQSGSRPTLSTAMNNMPSCEMYKMYAQPFISQENALHMNRNETSYFK